MADEQQIPQPDQAVSDIVVPSENIQSNPVTGEAATPEATPPDTTDQAGPDFLVSSNQKIIFVVFTLVLIGGGLFVTQRFSTNIQQLGVTSSPNAVPSISISKQVFKSAKFNASFAMPEKWKYEVMPSEDGVELVALAPDSRVAKCEDWNMPACPILLEFRDNRDSLLPEQFGPPFYPQSDSIVGGADTATVGNVTSKTLLNLYNTGGRITYISSGATIIKATVQNQVLVPMEQIDIFTLITNELVKNLQSSAPVSP